jgi:hypothetical protein
VANLVKSVMLKIVANDGDSEAKLDKITAKAEELSRLHPDLKVKVDSASASAKLSVLRKELKDTANAAAGDQTSLKDRLMSLGGAAGSVAGIGDAMTVASGDASMFQKVMAGAGLATGLLEPVAAGAIVAVGGLASGLTAAGAGLGVFGLVAKANLTTAATAAKQVQTAQDAYTVAIAHGTKQSVAYAAEQKAIASAYVEMTPAQIRLSQAIGNAQNTWQSFVQSNTAGVSKILTQGLGLLPVILKAIEPLMAPVESALSGIISSLSRAIAPARQMTGIFKGMTLPSGGGGFQSFIKMLADNAGPAITKIAIAIGHIGVGLAGVLKAFMPMSQTMLSGLDKITAKFATWGSTLSGHTGFQSLMSTFKTETPLAMKTLQNLVTVVLHLGSAMTGLSTASNSKSLLQVLTPLSGVLAKLSANQGLDRTVLYLVAAADAGKKLKGAFQGISGALGALDKGISLLGKFGGAAEDVGRGAKIASAATKVWTGIQAAFDVVMSANPIGLVIIAIGLLVAAIVFLVVKCKPFREFWISLWGDVEKVAEAAWHFVVKVVDAGVAGVKGVLAWFGRLPGLFRGWWMDAVNAVVSVTGGLLRFVDSIPGRILGALGNLGGLLFRAGQNIIQGLINGVTSMIGSVGHAIGGIVSDIRSFLPFSPAKKGPLSGTGSPDIAGRKIGQMLAAGIGSSQSTVAAAAHRMAGAATMAAGGGTAAALANSTLKIQLEWAGGNDGQIITALGKAIRVRGGNVQTVLGH